MTIPEIPQSVLIAVVVIAVLMSLVAVIVAATGSAAAARQQGSVLGECERGRVGLGPMPANCPPSGAIERAPYGAYGSDLPPP